jgi:valyl-tRNA synthetase
VRFDEGFAGGAFIERNAELVTLLVNASGVEFLSAKPAGVLSLAGRGFEVYVYAREAVDAVQLAARFAKEADKERLYIERTKAKLGTASFVGSAPAEIVGKERQKLKDAEVRIAKLERYIADLA